MDFRAQMHHLGIDECGETDHERGQFDFDQALTCRKYSQGT